MSFSCPISHALKDPVGAIFLHLFVTDCSYSARDAE